MGQRSQIYIRYNLNDEGQQYKGLIARYYSWNYGERMISRARYILEWINEYYAKGYKLMFNSFTFLQRLERICDVNFDMKDVVLSTDIIKEIQENEFLDIEDLFSQDNNDGQLYIDINDKGIKYCFTKYCHEGNPMTGEEYMAWNNPDKEDWHKPDEYLDEKAVKYTEDNIKAIDEIAALMTQEELDEFVNADYQYCFSN